MITQCLLNGKKDILIYVFTMLSINAFLAKYLANYLLHTGFMFMLKLNK